MGALLATQAPPTVQTVWSALMRTKLELALAGLDGSGKTTLVSVLRDPGEPPPTTAPTIGLVVQKARHNGIDLMMWDLGGHHRFREDWPQHVRGCGVLLFIVDVTDTERYGEARQALQRLLEDPVIGTMPLLVLANKVDLLRPAERAEQEVRGWPTLVKALNLDYVNPAYPWTILAISATRRIQLDKIMRWLVLKAHGADEDATEGDEHFHQGGGSLLWKVWGAVNPFSNRRSRGRSWMPWGKRRWTELQAGLVDD